MTGEPNAASLRLLREGAALPQNLGALPTLFGEARAAGLMLTVVSHARDQATTAALARRRHDIKAALRTLELAAQAIDTGYRFDDAAARAKLDAMARALEILAKESEILCEILGASADERPAPHTGDLRR